ncbi:MAG TPA: hypothetical protein VI094_01950 [Propionibacteriaceae bacterium]
MRATSRPSSGARSFLATHPSHGDTGEEGVEELSETFGHDNQGLCCRVDRRQRGIGGQAVEVAAAVDVGHPGSVAMGSYHWQRPMIFLLHHVANGPIDQSTAGGSAEHDPGRPATLVGDH